MHLNARKGSLKGEYVVCVLRGCFCFVSKTVKGCMFMMTVMNKLKRRLLESCIACQQIVIKERYRTVIDEKY
jgi:hypothetical protein